VSLRSEGSGVGRARRILLVSHLSTLSGAEQALLRLVGALDRSRVEPLVVLPDTGPLASRLGELGVRTEIRPIAWWIPATNWSRAEFFGQLEGVSGRVEGICALASEWGAELIHTNTVVTIEGALAAARLGLPHLWHLRAPFWKGHFPPAYFDEIPFFFSVVDQLSDHIVCVSREVERQIPEDCRLAPRSVILDGFERPEVSAGQAETREALARRYGVDARSRLVACVGGIQRRKGQLDLVEAAARLAPQFPDAVFVLCGEAADAEYSARVLRRIEELGLGSRFRFPGFEKDIAGVLAHVELLVHPALSEGFGLAILEAMAAGKPVVATRSGGPEEIVEDGVSGLLVPPGDPEALAAAVGRVLGDPVLAGALGRGAARRAGRFTLCETARQTEALYDRLLASDRPPEHRLLRAARGDAILAELLRREEAGAIPRDSQSV